MIRERGRKKRFDPRRGAKGREEEDQDEVIREWTRMNSKGRSILCFYSRALACIRGFDSLLSSFAFVRVSWRMNLFGGNGEVAGACVW